MMRSRLPFTLALALLCAQLIFAWHSASHIDPQGDPHQQALLVADCDLCAHGHGFVALPVASLPVAPTAAPVIGDDQPQASFTATSILPARARAPPHYA
ncbi:MAG: hypothetical protein ACPH3N_14505 [Alcanivorax sediminis]|uniref:DUF2946 domain-containing protein n=1 Tax=Alcanivorax sediminis TaxID=2663008 RepID=A0A6N7LRC9_9GAMM|nr:hypothetical protein [Alcanivorax sediminis]MQX52937.1 hypothetical protein [Alcanivorax sediminis]